MKKKRKVVSKKNWNLCKAINENDMNPLMCAEEVGISKTSIYSYINRRCVPLAETACKIAHVLGVKIETIFDEVNMDTYTYTTKSQEFKDDHREKCERCQKLHQTKEE